MTCLHARVFCVLYVLGGFTCFTCSRAWRARGLYGLDVLTCLACFIKCRAWRASKYSVLDVLHKIYCLKLSNCFLGVFDHGALVNCRLWIRSDVFNGRQEIVKPIITISFCSKFRISCLNLSFYTHL